MRVSFGQRHQPVRQLRIFPGQPAATSGPAVLEKDQVSIDGAKARFDSARPVERTMVQALEGENIRVFWREYGNPKAEHVVVCVHGLTRNSMDFDFLARKLAASGNVRVICPDIVGRGNSDWFQQPDVNIPKLPNPLTMSDTTLMQTSKYDVRTYFKQMQKLFDHLGLHQKNVTMVGTSMGGVISMLMAAQQNTPVRRLILNDVSPKLTLGDFKYLTAMVSGDPDREFGNLEEAKVFLKQRLKNFGEFESEEVWDRVTKASFPPYEKRDGSIVYKLHYDPKITESAVRNKDLMSHVSGLLDPLFTFSIRPVWNKLNMPTLIIRGENSGLLSKDEVDELVTSRPHVYRLDVPGAGHAPSLMTHEQTDTILDWLEKVPPADRDKVHQLFPQFSLHPSLDPFAWMKSFFDTFESILRS